MRRYRFVLISASAVLLAALRPAGARTVSGLQTEFLKGVSTLSGDGNIEVVSRSAFVRFKTTFPFAQRAAALSAVGAAIVEKFDSGWISVSLPAGVAVAQGLSQLAGVNGVDAVQPNRIFYADKIPGDPRAITDYHLGKINAYSAWEYETGTSSTVTIAVMDSGIAGAHPDLINKILNTALTKSQNCNNDPCVNEVPPTDPCNHGTSVAGLAAAQANNGEGSAGVSWGANLLSLKIFTSAADCDGTAGTTLATSEARIIRAISYAQNKVQNDPQVNRMVLNMSIGAPTDCNIAPNSGALSTAILTAKNPPNNIVFVAAAGNYAGSATGGPIQAPGNCEGVIPVGATDESDEIAGFSARGSSLAAHGVVAPGVSVPVPTNDGGYATNNGTSFSAPIVSGIAALILSAQPTFTPDQVKNTLRNSAEGIGVSALGGTRTMGDTAGAGRVNAYRAMRLAVTGTLAGWAGDERPIAFPNPFRPGTHGTTTLTVPLSLKGANALIRIYTISGQLVRDLGAQTTWDGKNGAGKPVATGTYVFNVKTDNGSENGRVMVVR